MAVKEVYVEVIRPVWIAGKQYGVGSIVKMKENEANMAVGLSRGKITEMKAEKTVPFKKAEAPKAEKK